MKRFVMLLVTLAVANSFSLENGENAALKTKVLGPSVLDAGDRRILPKILTTETRFARQSSEDSNVGRSSMDASVSGGQKNSQQDWGINGKRGWGISGKRGWGINGKRDWGINGKRGWGISGSYHRGNWGVSGSYGRNNGKSRVGISGSYQRNDGRSRVGISGSYQRNNGKSSVGISGGWGRNNGRPNWQVGFNYRKKFDPQVNYLGGSKGPRQNGLPYNIRKK
nr:anti-sigma-I factor RsgI-like [Pocillopora verrucosa]